MAIIVVIVNRSIYEGLAGELHTSKRKHKTSVEPHPQSLVFLTVIGIFKHFSDKAINLNVMDEASQSQLAWVVQSDCCHPCSVTRCELGAARASTLCFAPARDKCLNFWELEVSPTTWSQIRVCWEAPTLCRFMALQKSLCQPHREWCWCEVRSLPRLTPGKGEIINQWVYEKESLC